MQLDLRKAHTILDVDLFATWFSLVFLFVYSNRNVFFLWHIFRERAEKKFLSWI